MQKYVKLIIYNYNDVLASTDLQNINKAMSEIQGKTCVRFRKRVATDKDYVRITSTQIKIFGVVFWCLCPSLRQKVFILIEKSLETFNFNMAILPKNLQKSSKTGLNWTGNLDTSSTRMNSLKK